MPAESTGPDDIEQAEKALDEAVADRVRAGQAYRDASLRCRTLVVQLLRMGVRRQDLVDRPFTGRALTTIQQEEGLIRRHRRTSQD
jgi:hypothetical protein